MLTQSRRRVYRVDMTTPRNIISIRRPCAYPGDQEHDHEACNDATAEALAASTPRQRAAEQLRALADLLLTIGEQDMPTPDHISLSTTSDQRREIPEADRMRPVVQWARRISAYVSESDYELCAHSVIADGTDGGPRVHIFYKAPMDRYRQHRYSGDNDRAF
jgi:hypothetical protein